MIDEATVREITSYAELLGTLRKILVLQGKFTRKEAVEMATALLVATITTKRPGVNDLISTTLRELQKKGMS